MKKPSDIVVTAATGFMRSFAARQRMALAPASSRLPHDIVRQSQGEYSRGDIGTNTIEGFFSVFKRGMNGIYQHCGKKHLHRYAAEFEFRYNHRVANDIVRADRLLAGFVGKRLTYRGS